VCLVDVHRGVNPASEADSSRESLDLQARHMTELKTREDTYDALLAQEKAAAAQRQTELEAQLEQQKLHHEERFSAVKCELEVVKAQATNEDAVVSLDRCNQ
jgi:hypothetical protein